MYKTIKALIAHLWEIDPGGFVRFIVYLLVILAILVADNVIYTFKITPMLKEVVNLVAGGGRPALAPLLTLAAFFLSRAIARYASGILRVKADAWLAFRVRIAGYNRILNASQSIFHQPSIRQAAGRSSQGITLSRENPVDSTYQILNNVFSITVALFIIWQNGGSLPFYIISTLTGIIIVRGWFSRRQTAPWGLWKHVGEDHLRSLSEKVVKFGVAHRLTGKDKRELGAQIQEENTRYQRITRRYQGGIQSMNAVFDALTTIGLLALLFFYAGWLGWSTWTKQVAISAGALSLVTSAYLQISTALVGLSSFQEKIDKIIAAARRVLLLRQLPQQAALRRLPEKPLVAIEVKDATFMLESEAEPLVANVNDRLEPGFHLVVGRNGSGKRTLAQLMAGWLEPASGAVIGIFKDGSRFPLKELDQEHLISLVPKKTVIDTEETVGSFLTQGGFGIPNWPECDAGYQQHKQLALVHCLERAGLYESFKEQNGLRMSFSAAVTLALELFLKERGLWEILDPRKEAKTLLKEVEGGAGGKRLMFVARAVLRILFYERAMVLVLDEPEAELDIPFERRLIELLDWAMNSLQFICVFNTLSPVLMEWFGDKGIIRYIEAGQVVGKGSHDDLMANCVAYADFRGGKPRGSARVRPRSPSTLPPASTPQGRSVAHRTASHKRHAARRRSPGLVATYLYLYSWGLRQLYRWLRNG